MRRKNQLSWWLLFFAAAVVVNILAAYFHARFDLTADNRYSITPATKDLVRELDSVVTIDVFLKGDLPAEFRRLSAASQEFLADLRETNASKIRYRFVDPLSEAGSGKTWADSLQSIGASPINVNVQLKAGEENKIIFPYAVLKYGSYQSLVPLFQSSKRYPTIADLNNAEALMEYQFAKVLDQMTNPQRPSVAYAVGNGQPMNAQVFDLQQTISSNYHFGLYNVASQKAIPDGISVLLIVKPTEQFTDMEKLKIDQYIMRGGNVLWFIDNLHAEQDSLSFKSKLIAYERGLNIADLLFNYGVRINPDLIMDLQCDFLPFAVGGSKTQPQYEFLHWNYYPLFESKENHIINKGLGLVAGRYVNSIDTIEKAEIRKTFLLQSSSNSRSISTPALISPNENRNQPDPQVFNRKDIPAAVLLEGNFTSFFKNRLSAAQRDSLGPTGGFKENTSRETAMIVVADGDIVLNDVSPKQGPLPMGVNLFTVGSNFEFQFANRDFLLNCLEYLTSKQTIIQTRNKEIVLRLLDTKKVDEQKTSWQLITIALPVVLIIMVGIIYQQLRRYRFAR